MEEWDCLTEGQKRALRNETTEDIDLTGFAAALGSLDSSNIFTHDRALSRIVPPALLPKSGLLLDNSTIPDGSLSRVQGGNSTAYLNFLPFVELSSIQGVRSVDKQSRFKKFHFLYFFFSGLHGT